MVLSRLLALNSTQKLHIHVIPDLNLRVHAPQFVRLTEYGVQSHQSANESVNINLFLNTRTV